MLMVLSACGVDPCTIDSNSPTCSANRAVAKQTISVADATRESINAQSAMKATQNAVALSVQATQGAINSRATAMAVEQAATRGARAAEAESTRTAIELAQLRNGAAMTATMSAMVLDATRESIRAESTQTALVGEAKVSGAAVSAAAAGWQQMIVIVVLTSGAVLLVVGGLWYARRFAQTAMHGLEVKMSLVRYGPEGSHWALVSPGRDGQKHVLLTDGMVGAYSSSDGLLSTLNQLQVPTQVVVQVLADQMKRSQMVLAAQTARQVPGAALRSETVAIPTQPAPVAMLSKAAADDTLPVAQSFNDVLGVWKPTLQQMLLGFGRNGPVYCTIDDMLSIAVVGRPKTGKTTILRFIYAQCLLIGAQVMVWDLHRNLVKDLPGANSYTQLEQIEFAAEHAETLMRTRLKFEVYDDQPLMVLIDEWPLLARASDAIKDVVGRIVLEGRKVNIFLIVSGQGFPASLFGGSMVRDAFNSRYVCHTSTKQAEMTGLDKEFVPLVRNLPRGYAVLDGSAVRDPQIVAIPNTTKEDVTALITTSARSQKATSTTSGATSAEGEATSGEVVSAMRDEVDGEVVSEVDMLRLERVRELLRQRVPASKIVREVWGVSGGDAYQRAAREYSAVVALIVGGE